MIGLALVLATCLCFACNGVMAARATYRADAMLASFVAHLAGSVAVVLIIALSGNLPEAFSLGPAQLLILLLIGLAQFALGRSCFFLSLQRIGASRTQVIVQSNPLVSVAGAIVLFHEPLTPPMLVGVGCVMGGLWLITRERQ